MYRTALVLAVVAASLAACGSSSKPAADAGPTTINTGTCGMALAKVEKADGIAAFAKAMDVAVTVCDNVAKWQAAVAEHPNAMPAANVGPGTPAAREDAVAFLVRYCGQSAELAKFPLCKEALAGQ